MKGVILAGGLATRLRPLTWVTNKHLLPVYNKPMIYYSVEAMARAGIKEVLLSTGPDHAGDFANLLKAGEEFGLKLYYNIQANPKGGIANAVSYAEEFARGDRVLVLLGDGIFNFNLKNDLEEFSKKDKGCLIYGVRMPQAELKQYGIIEMDGNNKITSIVEKPENPKTDIVQTGVYVYDERAFEFIKTLQPSARGELEVTGLNNRYVEEGTAYCKLMDWWIDAGTSYDELLRANNMVAEKVRNGELS